MCGKTKNMLNRRNVISSSILFLLLAACFSSAYGGKLSKSRAGGKLTRVTSKLKKTMSYAQRQMARGHREQMGDSRGGSRHATTNLLGTTGHLQQPREFLNQTSDVSLSLSRRMRRQAALDMRPFLQSFEREILPQDPPFYRDIYSGILTRGNLTEMSGEQVSVAKKAYQHAAQTVRELSKTLNANIYYLGTAEAEAMLPEHMRQIFTDIAEAQSAVAQARVTWGDERQLINMSSYLHYVKKFYTMLSTGMYETIGKEAAKPVKRKDGHLYEASEFGLKSGQPEQPIPQVNLKDYTTWFQNVRGALPNQMRVAVLQDDKDIIFAVKDMKKRARLREWTFDFYDDPEAFLNRGSYGEYDMVLTDILMKNGGGRFLTRQLRNRKYEGIILALSGFEVSRHGGQAFFEDGIDGMIALSWTNDWASKIWYSLHNYFLLKEKYGWQH